MSDGIIEGNRENHSFTYVTYVRAINIFDGEVLSELNLSDTTLKDYELFMEVWGEDSLVFIERTYTG